MNRIKIISLISILAFSSNVFSQSVENDLTNIFKVFKKTYSSNSFESQFDKLPFINNTKSNKKPMYNKDYNKDIQEYKFRFESRNGDLEGNLKCLIDNKKAVIIEFKISDSSNLYVSFLLNKKWKLNNPNVITFDKPDDKDLIREISFFNKYLIFHNTKEIEKRIRDRNSLVNSSQEKIKEKINSIDVDTVYSIVDLSNNQFERIKLMIDKLNKIEPADNYYDLLKERESLYCSELHKYAEKLMEIKKYDDAEKILLFIISSKLYCKDIDVNNKLEVISTINNNKPKKLSDEFKKQVMKDNIKDLNSWLSLNHTKFVKNPSGSYEITYKIEFDNNCNNNSSVSFNSLGFKSDIKLLEYENTIDGTNECYAYKDEIKYKVNLYKKNSTGSGFGHFSGCRLSQSTNKKVNITTQGYKNHEFTIQSTSECTKVYGPYYALYSVVPGIGLGLSDIYSGYDDWYVFPLSDSYHNYRTVITYASYITAFSFMAFSNSQYRKYESATEKSEMDKHFRKANNALNVYNTSLTIAVSLHLTEFTHILVRGIRNNIKKINSSKETSFDTPIIKQFKKQ